MSAVIYKNVRTHEIAALVATGARSYRPDETWDDRAPLDDQTYPQPVVSVPEALRAAGHQWRKLRNIRQRARRNGIVVRPLVTADGDHVRSILKAHGRDHREAAMYWESHAAYMDVDLPRFVATGPTGVVAFGVVSPIGHRACAISAAIADMAWRWVTPTLIIEMATTDQLWRWVNLGGSETQGTDEFKRQAFHAPIRLVRTHMVYDLNGGAVNAACST
jgi:hypothetical protein